MKNPVKGLSLKLYRVGDGTPEKKPIKEVEKMKELNLKIKTCGDCPYAKFSRYALAEGTTCLCCEKTNLRKIHGDIDDFTPEGLPTWCPLDDAKDPGVKVGITGIVIRDGKVLLGLRGDGCQTAKNEWAYPGGRMDYGEEPWTTLPREILEETGMFVDTKSLEFLVWMDEFFPKDKKHYISLVFLVKDATGNPIITEPDKCKEWRWFDPDDIPENTFWACKENIERFKDKIKNPDS